MTKYSVRYSFIGERYPSPPAPKELFAFEASSFEEAVEKMCGDFIVRAFLKEGAAIQLINLDTLDNPK